MTTQTEALKLALEALKRITHRFDLESVTEDATKAITAAEEALAQPEKNFVTIVDGPFNHRCPETQLHIKEALAQPEQEPVAWKLESGQAIWFERTDPEASSALPPDVTMTPLYTTAPQRKEPEQELVPDLYVKDINGNFHSYKEKGHTVSSQCVPPSHVGVGEDDFTPQRKPLTDEHSYLVGALITIAEGTYDPWSNGAQAQRTAIAAIEKYDATHGIKE